MHPCSVALSVSCMVQLAARTSVTALVVNGDPSVINVAALSLVGERGTVVVVDMIVEAIEEVLAVDSIIVFPVTAVVAVIVAAVIAAVVAELVDADCVVSLMPTAARQSLGRFQGLQRLLATTCSTLHLPRALQHRISRFLFFRSLHGNLHFWRVHDPVLGVHAVKQSVGTSQWSQQMILVREFGGSLIHIVPGSELMDQCLGINNSNATREKRSISFCNPSHPCKDQQQVLCTFWTAN